MWKPYIVFKHGFKEKIRKYIYPTLKFYVIGVISILISHYVGKYVPIEATNIFSLILLFIVYGLISTIIIFVVFIIDKEFRNIINKYIKMFTQMIKTKILRS